MELTLHKPVISNSSTHEDYVSPLSVDPSLNGPGLSHTASITSTLSTPRLNEPNQSIVTEVCILLLPINRG